MEEHTSSTPRPNEFIIPVSHAYADTFIEIAETAEYLTTKLEPLNLETLGPEDRVCVICQQELHVSDDVKLSHAPVRTVCGHTFGRACITKWLDPLCYWVFPQDSERQIDDMTEDLLEHGKTSCPTCRRPFFDKEFLEPMELLAARLVLWDHAYAYVGIARSEKEERSRKYLWKHVKYCRSINDVEVYGGSEYDFLQGAQKALLEFAISLKEQTLSAVQEDLRGMLQVLGEMDLRDLLKDIDFSDIPWSVAYNGDPESEPRSADATINPHEEEGVEEDEEEDGGEEDEEEEEEEEEERNSSGDEEDQTDR